MDLADDLGLAEHQQIVVALEIVGVVLEALAAIAGLVKLVALNHGAHGAIENEDALARLLVQGCDALVAGHEVTLASAKALAGRKPSK